jgi:xanthine dehydrogenase iron-sulfur cluster and FAD-binding subunit A
MQERLYMCHGSQCGFCSPGMVMSMAGILCKTTTPDMEDLVQGLQVAVPKL